MPRLALVLCSAVLVSLSACEWEGRPDGMAPNNEGEMVFEPSDASDRVEEIDLGDVEIVEPLDAPVQTGAPTVGDAPTNPSVDATDRPLDANADAGDRDTPASEL